MYQTIDDLLIFSHTQINSQGSKVESISWGVKGSHCAAHDDEEAQAIVEGEY